MAPTPPGWDGILEDGETILWQGRPGGGVIWSDLISFESAFGLFFGGFAVFWTAAALSQGMGSGNGGPGALIGLIFPLFGLPFVAVGLYLVIGRLFWDAYLRGRSWYTLTNRAAYIATAALDRRKLKRYGYDEMTAPSLDDDAPGSVWFAEELRSYSTNRRRSLSGAGIGTRRQRTQRIPIGFRRIDGAREVYRLIARHRDAAKQASDG